MVFSFTGIISSWQHSSLFLKPLLPDVIYDFEVSVRQSGIPGGGLGAFLTFLGARVLTDRSIAIAASAFRRVVVHIEPTMEPLQALLPTTGRGVTVTLTGRNLHKNKNFIFWPMHDEAQLPRVIRNAHAAPDAADRIGHLGIHQEADYIVSDTHPFHEPGAVIDLGRYGPLLYHGRQSARQKQVFVHLTLTIPLLRHATQIAKLKKSSR